MAISVYGFYPVRDTLVGYPSIKLKNKEWITSQYGTPPVKISTPDVLRRIKSEKGGALRFSSGNYDAPFYIDLVFTKKPPKQQGEEAPSKEDQQAQQKEKIQELINAIINDFQSRGAVNILIKEEEITTISGLPALKIFGTLDYPKKGKKREYAVIISLMYLILNKGGSTLLCSTKRRTDMENPLKKGSWTVLN